MATDRNKHAKMLSKLQMVGVNILPLLVFFRGKGQESYNELKLSFLRFTEHCLLLIATVI